MQEWSLGRWSRVLLIRQLTPPRRAGTAYFPCFKLKNQFGAFIIIQIKYWLMFTFLTAIIIPKILTIVIVYVVKLYKRL